MRAVVGLLLCYFAACAVGTFAVDVSSAVMPTAWKCLRANGYKEAIIRAYRSSGSVDPLAPHTYYNALAGGYSHSDLGIYLFPCPRCGNPAAQVRAMMANMAAFKTNFSGMVWLDIEDTNAHSYWGTDVAASKSFISGLLSAAAAEVGWNRVGVYTNLNNWHVIFQSSTYNCCSRVPLWFAAYDGSSDPHVGFSPFGGWSAPAGKQYAGSSSVCGADVDLSNFP